MSFSEDDRAPVLPSLTWLCHSTTPDMASCQWEGQPPHKAVRVGIQETSWAASPMQSLTATRTCCHLHLGHLQCWWWRPTQSRCLVSLLRKHWELLGRKSLKGTHYGVSRGCSSPGIGGRDLGLVKQLANLEDNTHASCLVPTFIFWSVCVYPGLGRIKPCRSVWSHGTPKSINEYFLLNASSQQPDTWLPTNQ